MLPPGKSGKVSDTDSLYVSASGQDRSPKLLSVITCLVISTDVGPITAELSIAMTTVLW